MLLCVLLFSPLVRAEDPPQLWFYQSINLLPEENLDEIEPLWRRASAAGYTHVLLVDSKFGRLNEMGKAYFQHVDRVKKLAGELHLQIVPAVYPIGWSNDILGHNPNLAEGEPVKDALFVVDKNGEANLVPDPAVSFPAKPKWHDDSVKIEGGVATVRNNKGNARFTYELTVPPYRCYHVSVKIKTDHYSAKPELKALADSAGFALSYNDLGVKKTQDWTEHHIIFNSLDRTKVQIYFGVWDDAKGTLQWNDWKIEEVGLLNVLRRDGTPLVVKSDDRVLVEGKDFEPVKDPKLGRVPYAGEYQVWHAPPAIKTKLPEGTKLRVSWYHPAVINDSSVCVCLSERESQDLLADQAKRVRAAFEPKGMMMEHDEIRIMNHDVACQARHLTPGQILADNIAFCTEQLKGVDTYVWSDMFDPNHNAHDKYYLVNGTLAESWKGLPTSVTVMNWNFGKRDESLKFFAGRSNKQIISGYYDGNVAATDQWIASAKKVKGVVGYMYTTWQDKYDDLEAFAKRVRQ